jgi:hypothetical protein
MTKSDGGTNGKSDLVKLVKSIKDRLLPEKGADFEISYFNAEGRDVIYGQEPHSWVNATSEGVRVICFGDDFRVSMSRQRKPLIPGFFIGPDGAYRRMLRIAVNGDPIGNDADCYINIMGDLIVVTKNKVKCDDLCNHESLTDTDQKILNALKAATVPDPEGSGDKIVPAEKVAEILEEFS